MIEILLCDSVGIVIIFFFESDFQVDFTILGVDFFALNPKVKIFLIFRHKIIRSFHFFTVSLIERNRVNIHLVFCLLQFAVDKLCVADDIALDSVTLEVKDIDSKSFVEVGRPDRDEVLSFC